MLVISLKIKRIQCSFLNFGCFSLRSSCSGRLSLSVTKHFFCVLFRGVVAQVYGNFHLGHYLILIVLELGKVARLHAGTITFIFLRAFVSSQYRHLLAYGNTQGRGKGTGIGRTGKREKFTASSLCVWSNWFDRTFFVGRKSKEHEERNNMKKNKT